MVSRATASRASGSTGAGISMSGFTRHQASVRKGSQQFILARGAAHTQLPVGRFRGYAALRGALEVTFLDEKRLVDFFERVRFFADSHGKRTDADGFACELVDERFEDALV